MLDENYRIVGSPLKAPPRDLYEEFLHHRRLYPSTMPYGFEGWGGFLKLKYSLQRYGLEALIERFLRRKKYSQHDRVRA